MKQVLTGLVVSDVCDKTITVSVKRKVLHPKYKKYSISTKRYAVHDPRNLHKKGETISFVQCRPISATKHWIVVGSEDCL